MPWSSRVLPVLCAVVASCSSDRPRSTPQTSSIAKVVSLSGDVRIRRAGTTAWTPIHSVSEIAPDDMIQTLGSGSVVLRVTETGGELAMAAGTTMRFDASPRPHAVHGKLVAKTATDPTREGTLEVVTPPGVVVLSTPIGGVPSSAAIEVDGPAATIELLSGRGALREREHVVALERRRVTFGAHPVREVPPELAQIELVAPAPDAALRVRQRVDLAWTAVADADHYDIELTSGAVVRHVQVDAPPTSIGLTTGRYTWVVRALRGDRDVGRSQPRSFRVEVDDRAPPLVVLSPADGAVVTGERLEITGTTDPGAIVEVARSTRIADASGRFSLSVPIAPGLANIVVSARDDLGNARRVSRSVVCE